MKAPFHLIGLPHVYRRFTRRVISPNDIPVSLTCITCKIMNYIVCSQIGRHLDYNNILNPTQHGFRKGISCETPLVSTIHELAYSINRKNQTYVIFLYFSKSIDKVSHTKLLHKILFYGMNGKTNAWSSAIFGSSILKVVVNGQSSLSVDVLSGVPKGTVLGPMLFLLHINDINKGVNSQMRLFADDSIVCREIQTSADHLALESHLNKLHRWTKTWHMDFNVLKCAVLSATTKRKPSTYDYYMDDQHIPRTANHQYDSRSVLTSCGIHCILDVASDISLCFISLCFIRFTMDKFASICLPSLPQQMFALYKLRMRRASCIIYQHSFYVRFIPMWNSLTQEAVTAPTAEAFQKAAIEVIKSSKTFILTLNCTHLLYIQTF